jgi:calcineurin-like phosphoesterase family protein
MENIFFTSDTHFYHNKIQQFCPLTRKGANVEEMNELMIRAWNSRIKPRERVYHLGDFSFGSSQQTFELLERLNGQIHLVEGNHDRQLDASRFTEFFESKSIYKTVTIVGQRFVLMHTPIESWDRMQHGTIHLHGHLHGGFSHKGRIIENRMDVGIDTRVDGDMAPYHIDEVLENIKTQNQDCLKYDWVGVKKS